MRSREEDQQAADLLEVSASCVRHAKQQCRKQRGTSMRSCGGTTVIKVVVDRLAELVDEHPDDTIKELHTRLGENCVVSTV